MARLPIQLGQGTRPFATIALIVLCVAVHLYAVFGGSPVTVPSFGDCPYSGIKLPPEWKLVMEHALIPNRLFGVTGGAEANAQSVCLRELVTAMVEGKRIPNLSPSPAWLTVATSIFLHGDWIHLAVNMLVLLSFGSIVEHWVGPVRLVLVFLIAGIVGSLVQALASVYLGGLAGGGTTPVVGASAAIAGLLGFAMVTQPNMRMLLVVIPMPIWIAIVLLVVVHALAITLGWGQGIAWWGHLGGLVAGMLLAFVFRPGAPQPADDWQ